MLIAIEVDNRYKCRCCGELHTTETKGNTCCGEGCEEVFADDYNMVYVKEQNGVWHAIEC